MACVFDVIMRLNWVVLSLNVYRKNKFAFATNSLVFFLDALR